MAPIFPRLILHLFRARDNHPLHPVGNKYRLGPNAKAEPMSSVIMISVGYLLPYICSVLPIAYFVDNIILWGNGNRTLRLNFLRTSTLLTCLYASGGIACCVLIRRFEGLGLLELFLHIFMLLFCNTIILLHAQRVTKAEGIGRAMLLGFGCVVMMVLYTRYVASPVFPNADSSDHYRFLVRLFPRVVRCVFISAMIRTL